MIDLKQFKLELDKILNHLKQELNSLRASRATPAIVENILVESYGQKLPLKQLATINILPPSTILIQPWDKNMIEPITKAVQVSKLGMNPIVDGNSIRLTLPPLTEERRRDLIKLVLEKSETAKIAARNKREDFLREIQKQIQAKIISEDEKFRLKNELQKMMDKFQEEIKQIVDHKEKELSTV